MHSQRLEAILMHARDSLHFVRPVCLFALLLIIHGRSLAGVIYVDNRLGDDRYDGSAATAGSETTGPVRTIRRGLQLAQAGDTVRRPSLLRKIPSKTSHKTAMQTSNRPS